MFVYVLMVLVILPCRTEAPLDSFLGVGEGVNLFFKSIITLCLFFNSLAELKLILLILFFFNATTLQISLRNKVLFHKFTFNV